MTETAKIFGDIDNIIVTVDRFKMEPLFSEEKIDDRIKSCRPYPMTTKY